MKRAIFVHKRKWYMICLVRGQIQWLVFFFFLSSSSFTWEIRQKRILFSTECFQMHPLYTKSTVYLNDMRGYNWIQSSLNLRHDSSQSYFKTTFNQWFLKIISICLSIFFSSWSLLSISPYPSSSFLYSSPSLSFFVHFSPLLLLIYEWDAKKFSLQSIFKIWTNNQILDFFNCFMVWPRFQYLQLH